MSQRYNKKSCGGSLVHCCISTLKIWFSNQRRAGGYFYQSLILSFYFCHNHLPRGQLGSALREEQPVTTVPEKLPGLASPGEERRDIFYESITRYYETMIPAPGGVARIRRLRWAARPRCPGEAACSCQSRGEAWSRRWPWSHSPRFQTQWTPNWTTRQT